MAEEKEQRPQHLEIVEDNKLKKFASAFNFNQQELQHGYRDSIESYKDQNAFDFLLRDTIKENKNTQKILDEEPYIEFIDQSVEKFVNTCLIQELKRSQKQTSKLFI